jgi:membrane protein DedA with SNARE-associated domain
MDWTIRLMEALGYPGIVLIILLENPFPPIPSEVVLPFGGFMTTTGTVTFVGVMVASTLGSVLGAVALYGLGAWFGRERIYRFVGRFQRYLSVTPEDVKKAEGWFERYGSLTVFFCRMVPVMRSIISIPAGLVRMNLVTFSLYTLLGSLIWNAILVGVGALLGASWPLVTEWVGYYQDVVIVVGAVVAVLVVVYWFRRRRAV